MANDKDSAVRQADIAFNFFLENKPTMTIHADGRITLSDDAQPTEAAAACIEAMSDMIQNMIKNAVSRQPTQSDVLREENGRLREALRRCDEIVKSWNFRQNEKVEDVRFIVRAALQEQSK